MPRPAKNAPTAKVKKPYMPKVPLDNAYLTEDEEQADLEQMLSDHEAQIVPRPLFGSAAQAAASQAAADTAAAASDENILDTANRLAREGSVVQIRILRDNAYLCSKMPPYTIENLADEFGGGYYLIQLRDPITGHWKGKKTILIGNVPPKPAPLQVEEPREPQNQNTAAAPQSTLLETLALLEKVQEPARAAAKEAQERQQQAHNDLMKVIVTALGSSKETAPRESSSDVLLKVSDMMTQNTREIMGTVKEIMRDFQTQMITLKQELTSAQPKEDPTKAIERLIEIREKAEERAERRFLSSQKLARELADADREKIEEMLEERGVKPVKEKSMTDTLIESAIPLVTAQLAQAGAQRQAQAAAPRPRVVRRAAPALKAPPTAQNPNARKAWAENLVKKPKETPQPAETKEHAAMRDTILSTALPILMEELAKFPDHAAHTTVAQNVLTALTNRGIRAVDVTESLPEASFWAMIKEYGLEGKDDKWFRGFYEHLRSASRMESAQAKAIHGPSASA